MNNATCTAQCEPQDDNQVPGNLGIIDIPSLVDDQDQASAMPGDMNAAGINKASKVITAALAKNVPERPRINEQDAHTIKTLVASRKTERDAGTYGSNRWAEANCSRMGELAALQKVVAMMEGALKRGCETISEEMKRVPPVRKTTPKHEYRLRWYEIASIIFLALWVLVSIGVGLNNIAVILVNSGQPGFDEYFKAFLFSLVGIGLAFGLKLLYERIRRHSVKEWLALGTLVTGVIVSGIWVYLFSQLFTGLGTSFQDVINSVAANLESGAAAAPAAGAYSTYMIMAGVLAEAINAAGASMEISRLLAKQQTTSITDSEEYLALQKKLQVASDNLKTISALNGRLLGRLEEYKSSRALTVADFVACFYRF